MQKPDNEMLQITDIANCSDDWIICIWNFCILVRKSDSKDVKMCTISANQATAVHYGGDALQQGSKGRYGSRVGGR